MKAFVPLSPAVLAPSTFATHLSPRGPSHHRLAHRPANRPVYLPAHHTRCCAAPLPSTTYAASLQTDANDIDHAGTDSLIEHTNEIISSGCPLAEATLQQMVIHLADTRGMARLGLVNLFGKVGSLALPTLLEGLRTCPNPVVRRSCGKALAKIGDSAATDTLLATLVDDEDTVTRSSAAGALARMGKSAVPPLLNLISNPDVSMNAKGHAAWAIAFMQGEASDALFDSVHHPNQDVRLAVVSALGAVAIGDALPAMGTSSGDDWDELDPAKATLRTRAIAVMRTALDDQSSQVRAEAATALANAGCTEDVARIATMLTDTDPEMRRNAALALMKLGDLSVVAQLQERADDHTEPDSVRSVARLAVGSLQRMAEQDDDWD